MGEHRWSGAPTAGRVALSGGDPRDRERLARALEGAGWVVVSNDPSAAARRPAGTRDASVVNVEVLGAQVDLGAGAGLGGFPRTGTLTPREREVLVAVARGGTDAAIAVELGISISTVRSHLERVREKTGRRRRSELTRLAIEERVAGAMHPR